MPLEDIAIYEMDRATSRLELVKENLTRQFAFMTDRGPALYIWQNGDWYGTGGNPIPESDVPEKFRQEIADKPPKPATVGPTVTWVCQFCGEKMNYSEHDEHLVMHVNATLQAAGSNTIAPTPTMPADPVEERKAKYAERDVTAKNTHTRS